MMLDIRQFIFILPLFISSALTAQFSSAKHVIIVAIDGFRWQELFHGADSSVLFDHRQVKDTAMMKTLFWDEDHKERRKKLMPFVWNYWASRGQLWGNQSLNSKVSVQNPYRLSYPGYHEMLNGFIDHRIKTNKPKKGKKNNILHYIASRDDFQGRVALFGSWERFKDMVDTGFVAVNAGYQIFEAKQPGPDLRSANEAIEFSAYKHLGTRPDMLTFSMAKDYMRATHPRLMFIGLGETDEFAHHRQYDLYLNQASLIDKMLCELWTLIQHDPYYKDQTLLIVTTDHGRGRAQNNWHRHGFMVPGSQETWIMMMGAGVEPLGEMENMPSVRLRQIPSLISSSLGLQYQPNHRVAASFIRLKPLPGKDQALLYGMNLHEPGKR